MDGKAATAGVAGQTQATIKVKQASAEEHLSKFMELPDCLEDPLDLWTGMTHFQRLMSAHLIANKVFKMYLI